MELKHLTKIIYRIEPKPEGGGFIARAADPAVPPIEAPTREELQQKIQAEIFGKLAAEFPGLKLSLGNRQPKLDDAKELAGLIAENFPEISQALAARGADAKTFGSLDQQKDVIAAVGSPKLSLNIKRTLLPTGLTPAAAEDVKSAEAAVAMNVPNAASNAPITPEAGSGWKILGFLLFLLIFALVYSLRHH